MVRQPSDEALYSCESILTAIDHCHCSIIVWRLPMRSEGRPCEVMLVYMACMDQIESEGVFWSPLYVL